MGLSTPLASGLERAGADVAVKSSDGSEEMSAGCWGVEFAAPVASGVDAAAGEDEDAGDEEEADEGVDVADALALALLLVDLFREREFGSEVDIHRVDAAAAAPATAVAVVVVRKAAAPRPARIRPLCARRIEAISCELR